MNDVERWLDGRFEAVILQAREHFPALDLSEFVGKVSGFLLVTSIRLAHQGGCPRRALEAAIASHIAKAYGS